MNKIILDKDISKTVGRIAVKNGYAVSKRGVFKNKRIDKIIWEINNGEIPYTHTLYHKNQNKLDNRLENLELVTNAEYQVLTSIRVDLDGV